MRTILIKKSPTHIHLLLSMLFINSITNKVKSQSQTYAEKLGWKKDERVIMFHVDDAGMSHQSNQGAIHALEKKVATSVSIMMPCPWTSHIINYVKQHPDIDAGLHLTHTAEWTDYRWSSVTGKNASPGLSDKEGALWNNVFDVVNNASVDEIEAEIKAQLYKAKTMGLNPTHLDTHMGILWATPEFLNKYIKIGIEEHIPVLFSAGHNTLMRESLQAVPLAGLKNLNKKTPEATNISEVLDAIRDKGEEIWNAGLAVVDDLYISSYDWEFPSDKKVTDKALCEFKTYKYKELLRSVKPGITVILIHCTDSNEEFKSISNSGNTRRADMLAMAGPELKAFIQKEGFILTTWRELQNRRDSLYK
ncbi:MAG TPA: polysaccharide deacetylase family protein [Cyclobacteriaceae bacterium]